jgi:hypothetical protein
MAIAIRGTATSNTAMASPLTMTYPTGIQAGDVLVATIHQRGGSGASISPPGGWTSKLRTNNGTSSAEETFYKIATGSESGTVGFTLTGQVQATGEMSAWSGVDTTGDPTDGSGGQTGSSTATVTAPSISPTQANDLLLFGAGGRSPTGANTYTADAAMTERAESDNNSGSGSVSSELASQALTATGATGTRTSTATTTLQVYAAQLVALKPAAVVGGGTIKVWTGSAWVLKPVKVWTGSAWVAKPVKFWNGTAWVLA